MPSSGREHLNLSLADAKDLFQRGEFAELVRRANSRVHVRVSLEPGMSIRIAHALVLIGDWTEAEKLLPADLDQLSPVLRSRASLVRGLIAHATGTLSTAAQHFKTAVRLANESKNARQIAWAYVYLLNHLVNIGPHEVVTALVSDVRKAVVQAGDPRALAYLHQAITMLEGQTGGLVEARRHCELAASLLTDSPSVWLATNNLLNRACVDMLTCRYSPAARAIQSARKACSDAGLTRGVAVADSNLGHVHLQTGNLRRALQSFERTIGSPFSSTFARLGALEGTARAYLALGQLDKCESALDRFAPNVQTDSQLSLMYHVRWSAITRARLSLRRNDASGAIQQLLVTERRIQGLRDKPLEAAIDLTLALALRVEGKHRDAASRLLAAERTGVTRNADMQAQYYWTAAALVFASHPDLAVVLRDRALAVWNRQSTTVVPREIHLPRGLEDLQEDSSGVSNRSLLIVNALGSAIDLGHAPELLGKELQRALSEIGCRAVIANRVDHKEDLSTTYLDLGAVDGKALVLSCEKPFDSTKSLLMADVLRIGDAARQIEKMRLDERNRAALWPADPIETEAGALFLAAEMQTLLATVRQIAPMPVPILLTGETGTGKEVVARLIHAYSNRAKHVFQPFNCSAVPRDMLDSQLFGHRRGSFTGAAENFQGVIRAAAGGTLLLDEIGDTTLDVQPKLLRFLESHEVHPIGEPHPTTVDVRVIAATNADLPALVSQGRFREDLLYRLNTIPLHLPPLRERRVEIPALAHHYLQKHSLESGKTNLRLSEETMEFLVLYRWPGNIRQLANEMRRVATLAESGAVIMPEHLHPDIAASRRTIPASQRTLDPTEVVVRLDQPLPALVQHVEMVQILRALRETGWNMEQAAGMLGLTRKGLYLKRKRYRIETPGEPGGSALT